MRQDLGSEMAYPLISPDGMAVNQGLTKRELFAAMAMQGMLANNSPWPDWGTCYEVCAAMSKQYADSLINELNKPQQP